MDPESSPLTSQETTSKPVPNTSQSETIVDINMIETVEEVLEDNIETNVLQREPQQMKISGKAFENKGSVLVNVDSSADTGTHFITVNPPSKWDYIAICEPTEALLNDDAEIWKILLDERCSIIISLTSLSEKEDVLKFDQYLLSREKDEQQKNITLICDSGHKYANYAVRKLTVKRKTGDKSEEKEVFLVRYFAWPDKWDADNFHSLLEFHKCVNAAKKTDLDGPTLVHSSVGVHRCTTYIVFDMLTKESKYQNPDAVGVCLQHLNRQRLQTNLEETEFLIQMLLQPPSENIKHKHVTDESLASNTVSLKQNRKKLKKIGSPTAWVSIKKKK